MLLFCVWVVLLMGEFDEFWVGSGWGSGWFGCRLLLLVCVVGDGVEWCCYIDVFVFIVFDVYDGVGVWVDYELDVLVGEFVWDFELFVVI